MNPRKNMSSIAIFLTTLISVLLLLGGCSPAKRPNPNQELIDIQQPKMKDIGEEQQNLTMNGLTPIRRPSPQEIRQEDFINRPFTYTNLNVERSIEQIAGIQDAVVILHNETAFVGIEAEAGVNINTVGGLQSQVASRVRNMITDIERVYITSYPDQISRLREYAGQINQGRPIQNFIKDIEDMF